MKDEKMALPVWTKLVLAFLLLITALGAAGMLFFSWQNNAAQQADRLPMAGGYSYCDLSGTGLDAPYTDNSLLLIRWSESYNPGDDILAAAPPEAEVPRIGKEYFLLCVESAGETLSGKAMGGAETFSVSPGDVVGRVEWAVSGLGGIYRLMLDPFGSLLFLILPIALTVVWAAVMAVMSLRRQERAERVTEEAAEPSGEDGPEAFDLFAELPPESAGASVSAEPAFAPVRVGETIHASPLMDPVGRRALVREAARTASAARPEPAVFPQEKQPPAPPAREPIHMGDTMEWEPSYLQREVSGSLSELRDSLKKQPPSRVGIVLDGQTAGVEESDRRRLEQMNSFDPDRVIAEIKRQNVLYEQALGKSAPRRLQEVPAPPPAPPVQRRAEDAWARELASIQADWEIGGEKPRTGKPLKTYRVTGIRRSEPPTRREVPLESLEWEDLERQFLKNSSPPPSLDEITRLHRLDFDEQRFRPSYITVVGEETEASRSPYYNRNGQD